MSNTKQGLIVLAIFLALALLWFARQDPEFNNLNNALKADPELSAYPYQFRAIKLENGVATLSSPRSPQVSVLQFFNIAFPNLDTSNPDTPEMIEAQKRLAHLQEKAGKLVKEQPGVQEVQWEIDKSWYSSHGLMVE
ncbi:MAG: hypothetical protein KJ914_16545 [Gammaproteobacteria bacterium]|nr:hypothetical protein [Gammaproteobacteria bacterium]MBU1724060.1 hypothetical protein [Gammaproteobacteria bacterium]MBU2006871.1 hypothetical protein [Gammaproteobacteria bacterium]